MPNIRMPDGIVVKFPDDMPKEEIQKLIEDKYKTLQKEDNQDKELDDESIGIGESITDKSTTLGSRVYNMYRYASESGWNAYESTAQQAFANIPGLFLTAEEQKQARLKDAPKEEGGRFKAMLSSWYDFHKDQQEKDDAQMMEAKKKAGTGFTQSVIQGLAQTPGTIALYAPAVVTGGAVGGFAGMNMLLESEKKEGETGFEYAKRVGLAGVEGGLSGKLLQGLNMFGIPTRLTGMALMGASGPAENAEERIANATTFAVLGLVGPKLTAQSKIDTVVENFGNKTKEFLTTQKNIREAEKAISNTEKSLAAIIDQYNLYEKKVGDLSIQQKNITAKKEKAKSEENKNEYDTQIKNISTEINSLNSQKGKLKDDMESISAVIRDHGLFSTKFMRDFDMVASLTPTEAKLVLVGGKEITRNRKKKNAEGKYEIVEENITIPVANTKKMTPIKADTLWETAMNLFTKGGRRQALPAKFLGDYPVAKYGVDLVSKYVMEVNYMTQLFLENPKAFQTSKIEKVSGFNPMRYSSLTPSEGGALVRWKRLSTNEQLKVIETMKTLNDEYTLYRKLNKEERIKDDRFDNKTGEATPGYVGTFGLSQEGIVAMKDIQKSFDGIQKIYNDFAINYGGKNVSKINKRPNYFPQIYLGQYKVFVNTSKGDLVGVYGADNIKQANRIKDDLTKDNPELTINVRSKTVSEVKDYSAEMFQDIMQLANRNKTNQKTIDAIDKLVTNIYREKGFNIRKMTRKGKVVEGYLGTYGSSRKRLQDFEKAITMYINGGIQSAFRMKLANDFTTFYKTPISNNVGIRGQKTIADIYPTDFQLAETVRKNATGLPINELVKQMRGSPIGSQLESAISKWYIKSANLANTWFLLALNPRFLMLQGIQPLQMLPQKLAGMSAEIKGSNMIDATAHAYYSVALGMMRTFKPTEFNIALNKSAVRQGVITEAMLKEYLGETYYSKGKINPRGLGKKIWGTVKGTVPAGFMERFTRLQAVNTVGEHMLSLGYSKEFVIKQAPYLANKLMVEYHASQRPLIYSMAGAISRPAGLFKTYAHNWYAQMVEAIQKAEFKQLTIGRQKLPIPIPKGQTTQLANFVASQAIFGGLKGVVGVTFIDALVKGLNATGLTNMSTLSDLLIKMGLPDVFFFGGPSTVLNADMSNSLQAPTTDPTELITFPSLEFSFNAASGILELSKYYLNYKLGEQLTGEPLLDITPIPPSKVRDAWKKVTPTSYHGWIESWYQGKDNPFYIKNSVDNYKRDEEDWWARKWLAMRSLKESKYMTFTYMMKQQMGKESMGKSDIARLMAESFIKFQGDIGQAWQQWMYDLAEEKGFKNPKELHDAIKRQLSGMQQDFFDKMSKGGITEQEMDIYEQAEKNGIVGDE
jgi:hypothetical protein